MDQTTDPSSMMDPAEEEIEFISSKTEPPVNRNPESAKAPLTSTLSPTTKHADDAERFIQDAMEEEKLSEARYRKTLRDFALLDVDSETLNIDRPSQPEVKSGLAANTALLDALHRAGEPDPTGSKTAVNGIDKSELADADSLRRVSIAGWVLKKAADLKKRTSTRSQMSFRSTKNPKQSSSSSQSNITSDNAQPDVEAGEAETIGNSSHHGSGLSAKARRAMHITTTSAIQEWSSLHDFFQPKRQAFFRQALFYIYAFLIPSLITALLLFQVENAPVRCTALSTLSCEQRPFAAFILILSFFTSCISDG